MKRLHSLDYLRGLAACSIMIFHYVSWHYGHLDASSFLGRIGLYGVSIFYILSGLTLYCVYYGQRLSTGIGQHGGASPQRYSPNQYVFFHSWWIGAFLG